MSIVRFTGGLGNQLFQICFGRTLGVTTGTSTIYDAAEYKYRSRNAERKLEIPKSCEISIINRTNLLISKLPNNFLLPIETKQRGKIDWRSSHKNKIILEGRDIYDRELVLEPNSYYVGNFVSYRYWKEDPEVILSWISKQINLNLENQMRRTSNTIGVHVRRGDYLINPKVRNLHGYCTDEYYLKSIEQILELDSSVREIFFSTDSFAQTIGLREKIEQLGLTIHELSNLNPLDTLRKLSFNDYFVGSNSTFSWWAAALNPKKLSIFPTEWFISGTYGFEFKRYFPYPVMGIENALSSDPLP
jgi:hypothetical protein